MKNIIEMRGIVKRFGNFTANDHIDLLVREGEIHALLGENGAGKSTLMNILYGLYRQDAGEIYCKGKLAHIREPGDAMALNIGMVHQHFMLVQPFTVAENLILGKEPVRGLRLDMAAAKRRIRQVSEEYHFEIDPDARAADISVGMQQRVEILKILLMGAEILIFDEPTATLTPQEIQDFFEICRVLQRRGHTIIIITHKLKEISQISDRVTVIRSGKNIATVETSKVDEGRLAEMMVGRAVRLRPSKERREAGEVVLEMRDVHAKDPRGLPALRGLSLQVRSGEIVGIAGVEGNGQSEIAMVLKGLAPFSKGEVRYQGRSYGKGASVQRLIDSGVSHIPEDRQKSGLVLGMSIRENMILGMEDWARFKWGPFQKQKEITAFAEEMRTRYDIRCTGVGQEAQSLSGGNQQKVILAREIARDPQFMIVCQPTRGLDVGAIEYIHAQILEQRKRGCAILLISYELDEIMELSDRILTIYNGEITAEYQAGQVTSEQIGLAMAGFRAAERTGQDVPEKKAGDAV